MIDGLPTTTAGLGDMRGFRVRDIRLESLLAESRQRAGQRTHCRAEIVAQLRSMFRLIPGGKNP
jgi:hypothetical protein